MARKTLKTVVSGDIIAQIDGAESRLAEFRKSGQEAVDSAFAKHGHSAEVRAFYEGFVNRLDELMTQEGEEQHALRSAFLRRCAQAGSDRTH